ncbi:MAG: DNA primase family protein [Syntrophales bacterium]
MQKKVFPLSDLGNSERFIARHGDIIRYNPRMKAWLYWGGKQWSEDVGESEIFTKAKETVRAIGEEANIDPSLKLDILKHANKSETMGKIGTMIKLSRSVPELQVQLDQLDSDPWLLNCANGTVDLRNGDLLPHDRQHLITRMIRTPYNPEATCPRFLQFLDEIMDGNENMVAFLQRVFGYALTGSALEQALFFLVGNGANGKTTLIEALRRVFGIYCMHTPTATLIKNNMQIRNDIARLKGARMVTASEVTKGKSLDEATTKMLTGEDPVTSRLLYKELFEYRPNFKIFLLANHLPEISGSDFGIWRRIVLIPFPVKFDGENRDKNLQVKLAEEAPGILAWLVRGCIDWQRDGLLIPTEVKVATERYKSESDILPQFLADSAALEKTSRVTSKVLYEAYRGWAAENTDDILKQKAFGVLLKVAGFRPSKSDGVRFWNGLRLKPKAAQAVATEVLEKPVIDVSGVTPAQAGAAVH